MESKTEKELQINCPKCNDHNCHGINENGKFSYLCYHCGYHTNSNLVENSQGAEQYEGVMYQLIKDLRFHDTERKLYWYPCSIPSQKGIIFAQGTKEDWKWSVAPVVSLTEEEKKNYPIPGKDNEFYDKRVAVELALLFAPDDFVGATQALNDFYKTEDAKV